MERSFVRNCTGRLVREKYFVNKNTILIILVIITPLTGLPGCPMSGVLRAKGVVASAALVLSLQPHAASRKAPHAPGRICLSVRSPRRRREGPHFAGETGKALRELPASRSAGSDPRVPPVTAPGVTDSAMAGAVLLHSVTWSFSFVASASLALRQLSFCPWPAPAR